MSLIYAGVSPEKTLYFFKIAVSFHWNNIFWNTKAILMNIPISKFDDLSCIKKIDEFLSWFLDFLHHQKLTYNCEKKMNMVSQEIKFYIKSHHSNFLPFSQAYQIVFSRWQKSWNNRLLIFKVHLEYLIEQKSTTCEIYQPKYNVFSSEKRKCVKVIVS